MNLRDFNRKGGRTIGQILDKELEKIWDSNEFELSEEILTEIRRSVLILFSTLPPYFEDTRVLPQGLKAEGAHIRDLILDKAARHIKPN
ncbi:hypothetical protein ACFLZH_04015 [Patescibacteria group bacterium]